MNAISARAGPTDRDRTAAKDARAGGIKVRDKDCMRAAAFDRATAESLKSDATRSHCATQEHDLAGASGD